MIQHDNFVPLDTLIALAAGHGQRINARWLAKYARKGLLSRALDTPGVGQGKGRAPRYPLSTPMQLEALIQQRHIHGKNLRNVGWALWRDGFPVDRRYWKPRLARWAKLWQRQKRLFAPGDSMNIGATERKLKMFKARLARSRKGSPIFGPAKRGLKDNFGDFVDAILSVAAGKYERISNLSIYDEEEADWQTNLLAKALRIPNDLSKSPQPQRLPVDAVGMDEQFAAITKLTRNNIEHWFSKLSEAEIVEGRDELFQFVQLLLCFEDANARLLKKSLGADVMARCWRNVDVQASMLIGWLYLRKNKEKRENIRKLIANMRTELVKLRDLAGEKKQ